MTSLLGSECSGFPGKSVHCRFQIPSRISKACWTHQELTSLFFDLIVCSMHLVNLKLLGHLICMVEHYEALIKGLALIQFHVLEP